MILSIVKVVLSILTGLFMYFLVINSVNQVALSAALITTLILQAEDRILTAINNKKEN